MTAHRKGDHGGCWTDINAAECKRLALLGWSGRQIATALGLSRNQVIGKVFRMGLTLGGGHGATERARHQVRRVKATTPPKPTATSIRVSSNGRRAYPVSIGVAPAPSPAHDGPTVSLIDLGPHACRWPYGDGPYTFCGKPKDGEGSYCVEHDRRAHLPSRLSGAEYARAQRRYA